MTPFDVTLFLITSTLSNIFLLTLQIISGCGSGQRAASVARSERLLRREGGGNIQGGDDS